MSRYFLVVISSNLINRVTGCKQEQESGGDNSSKKGVRERKPPPPTLWMVI